MENIKTDIREDKLCLITYNDILNDKRYSNIGEYLLRCSPKVSNFLKNSLADDKAVLGECSDFDLLRAFLASAAQEGARGAAVLKSFEHAASKLLGHGDVLLMSAEALWGEALEKLELDKNSTVNAIAASGLDRIGIPVSADELANASGNLLCGSVEINCVGCPFGTKSISFDTIMRKDKLADVYKALSDLSSSVSATALFFDGYSFEKPNEYGASLAYEKLLSERKLSIKENAILSTQLIRAVARTVSDAEGELMMFLPSAPDVRSMGAAQSLLDYLDEDVIERALRVTVFSCDAVGACMAAAMAGKRYKNITAVTGISGNGSGLPDASASEYWGCGVMSLQCKASLAKNAGYLSSF